MDSNDYMKYFFPILMALTILGGIALITTPYLMNYLFPPLQQSVQTSTPKDAAAALQRWFEAPDANFKNTQALREIDAEKNITSYFVFETEPDVIRKFINLKKLKQLPLTREIMQGIFINNEISWWKPEELTRKTYFMGEDYDVMLSLIYNADMKRGMLLLQQE